MTRRIGPTYKQSELAKMYLRAGHVSDVYVMELTGITLQDVSRIRKELAQEGKR
ncbi:MAG: hypothetical protein K2Q12_07980 [Rickettsiales bacterium]|nr:hypothetical protein [Rickettsiales bacterium]